ncbi:MAG: metal ABC transporter substrate-binding protein [Ignavibacteria bacterium]|jgi:ABC-type Zn uptake system ZnuABC Zn-binding protein ZnuA|nr:metal ABC transporter substrate-binding protein [Ignavibacteria bacterium]
MNKYIVAILLLLSTMACTKQDSNNSDTIPTIAVTINPLKLILQEIAGSSIHIVTLLPPSVSPHNYEPRPSDVAALQNSKLLFYVDDNLDGWVTKLATTANIPQVKLMDYVNKNGDTLNIGDVHFWLSPLLVKSIANDICDALISVDSGNATQYKERTKAFIANLDALHKQIEANVSPILNIPIFTEHNSFGCFIKEFGLLYGGCIEDAGEKEKTLNDFQQLIIDIKQSDVPTIFSEPQFEHSLLNRIAKEENVNIHQLDPIGSAIGATWDGKKDTTSSTYFHLLQANTKSLIDGLLMKKKY